MPWAAKGCGKCEASQVLKAMELGYPQGEGKPGAFRVCSSSLVSVLALFSVLHTLSSWAELCTGTKGDVRLRKCKTLD